LFGAAEALASTIGYVRRRPEQERLERAAAIALASLGDAGFAAAWAAGQALPSEQVVAEAQAVLAVLGAAGTPSTTTSSSTEIAALTPREQQVLALMCAHLQDREIAERLFLSPRTVEGHVSHILGKLGVSTRRDAAAVAARLGLL
jgi:DNA-binding NarL/FixJ family response regulator